MMIYIAIISVACQLLLAWLLFMRKSLPLHSPIFGCFLCLTHLLFPIFIISEVSIAELPLFTTELTLGVLFLFGERCDGLQFWNAIWKNTTISGCVSKKSVEGAVAAVLFSPVIAFINVQFFSNDDYYYWLFIGILISITSIVGDLVQSQFKRTYGVK